MQECDVGGYDGGNGGPAAESSVCAGVLMHGGSVLTLRRVSAGGGRKGTLELPEGPFLLQH